MRLHVLTAGVRSYLPAATFRLVYDKAERYSKLPYCT